MFPTIGRSGPLCCHSPGPFQSLVRSDFRPARMSAQRKSSGQRYAYCSAGEPISGQAPDGRAYMVAISGRVTLASGAGQAAPCPPPSRAGASPPVDPLRLPAAPGPAAWRLSCEVNSRGHGVVDVAKRLSMSDKSLYLRVRFAQEQQGVGNGRNAPLNAEVSRLSEGLTRANR